MRRLSPLFGRPRGGNRIRQFRCRPSARLQTGRGSHIDDGPAKGALQAKQGGMSRVSLQGFSTIEVMVMVAIIALSLVPIMGVQSQVVRAYTSYKDHYAEMTLVSNSLELITRLNPYETPEGYLELDPRFVLRWKSSPLSQPVRSTGYPSGSGDFEVTLYRIDATIETSNGQEVSRFSVDQLGWVKILKDEAEPSDFG